MAAVLKVTPDQLISTASEFSASASAVKASTSEMIAAVDALKGTWEGEASLTYSTKFHGLQDDMDRMYSMIQEHVRDLEEMARQYKDAEATNVETIDTLPIDVIE